MRAEGIAKLFKEFPFLRPVGFFIIHITTLREWYLRFQVKKYIRPNLNILDAGCGLGQHSVWMSKKYPSCKIMAIDIEADLVESLAVYGQKKRLENLFCQVAGVDTTLNDKFDLIFCSSVLEHVPNDDQAIKNLYEMVNPNGILLLYVPQSEKRVLKSLERKIENMVKAEQACLPHGHVRYYSPNQMTNQLEKNGFKIEKQIISYGPLGRFSYDIVTSVQYSRYFKFIFPFYLLLIHPFIMILMGVDFVIKNKKGNGLLVVARK